MSQCLTKTIPRKLQGSRFDVPCCSGMYRIVEGTAPDFKNKSHTITAEIEVGNDVTSGVLVTQGGRCM